MDVFKSLIAYRRNGQCYMENAAAELGEAEERIAFRFSVAEEGEAEWRMYTDFTVSVSQVMVRCGEKTIECRDKELVDQRETAYTFVMPQPGEVQVECLLHRNSLAEQIQLYKNSYNNKIAHIELLLAGEREQQKSIAKQQGAASRQEEQIRQLSLSYQELEALKKSKMYRLLRLMCRGMDFLLWAPRRCFAALRAFAVMMTHVNLAELRIAWGYVREEGLAEAYRHLMRDYHRGQERQAVCIDKKAFAKITDLRKCRLLIFPEVKEPKVSIVIPVYNQFTYTYCCLQSILENSGEIPYEVIVADDHSDDLTVRLSEITENVRIIRNEENLYFLKNCNHAAKYAQGEYILFLNNDTQVQKDWLRPLCEVMERDDKAGIVGSKLIYPDGTLQEAGGIIWKDASGWNYGRGCSASDAAYNYVRETDYVSGASLMIRRSLWDKIGGFDSRLAPAYYEDTDLAFEAWRHGYRVMYQPLSVVVHFEGISNGTDVSSGLKSYQAENQKKFYEKWKETLQREQFTNGVDLFLAKDRCRLKKRILVVDHYVPNYDKDAGGKCTYMYLCTFLKMGMKVTFIGDNFAKTEPYTTELTQLGIEILYGDYYYGHWQEWMQENGKYFDYIYLQRPHISVKYIDLARKYSRAKIFYFAHDLHHIREYRQYELDHNQETLASSERWKKIEYELFDKADVGHVVGSYEQAIMQKAFPQKPIRNIPLYIYDDEPQNIEKDFSKRRDIVYVGGFGHPPNEDAVLWFAREVFPKVRQRYPDIRWHVVGSRVTSAVQALADANILIEGFQPDEVLHRLYRTCRMAVVPLRYGAGVKGKVVEAAYFQIPLLTTSIGAEGLEQENAPFVVVDEAEQMARRLCALYEDYETLRTLSDRGKDFIRRSFTLEAAEKVLREDMT